MTRSRVRKEYRGIDGKLYRGKGIKARKRLELRIHQYEQMLERHRRLGIRSDGYHRPGSMQLK